MFCFCHRAAFSHPSFCWAFLPHSDELRISSWLRGAFIFKKKKNYCPSSDIKHHLRMTQWPERCNRSKKQGEKKKSSAIPVSLGSKLFNSISWQSKELRAGGQQREKPSAGGWERPRRWGQWQWRQKDSFNLEEIKRLCQQSPPPFPTSLLPRRKMCLSPA